MKKIAFITVALNEEKRIGSCIDSISRNTYKNNEIVVVDGGSKDRTVEIAKSKGAKVIAETGKNKCPANAWNVGMKRTNAELVCLIAADFLLYDEKFIEKTVKPFDNPKVASVAARPETKEATLVEKIVSALGDDKYANVVFRRDIVLKIGGFPILGFGEDRIFVKRYTKYAKEHNLCIEQVPDTRYSGHTVQTWKELFKQSKWYGRTSILYLKEYSKESDSFTDKLKETLAVNYKAIYFALFALSLISLKTQFFLWFFAPFAAIALITILKNISKPYHILKIFTNILAGFGFLLGVMEYLLGANKTKGRG